MFDLGFSEMLLTGVVALVVLGPERLPKVARAAGLWLGRLQRFVSGVKNELSRQMDAEGLSEVKEDFQAAVREAQEGWRDARHALQSQADGIDPELPAWERALDLKFSAADDSFFLKKMAKAYLRLGDRHTADICFEESERLIKKDQFRV